MATIAMAVAVCHVGLLQEIVTRSRSDDFRLVETTRSAPLQVRWVVDGDVIVGTDVDGRVASGAGVERHVASAASHRSPPATRPSAAAAVSSPVRSERAPSRSESSAGDARSRPRATGSLAVAHATAVPSAAFERVTARSGDLDVRAADAERRVALPDQRAADPDPVFAPGSLLGPRRAERSDQLLAEATTTASDEPAEPREAPVEVPTYRTRPPGALHLAYQLRRGMLTGTGDFDWKPDGGSYEMRLDGKVAGFSVLSWVSRGGFDAAGLAPVRYTDQRRSKQTLAANFQRGQGVITYSQPQTEHPLVPGAQDRLSWMIQLPSILAADASLARPDAHVAMFVTGARGDADVWSFRVVTLEPVSTPAGTLDAVHLVREARKPHDTQVDVWLDPKRGYLPVQARMANEGGGEAFELSLR